MFFHQFEKSTSLFLFLSHLNSKYLVSNNKTIFILLHFVKLFECIVYNIAEPRLIHLLIQQNKQHLLERELLPVVSFFPS